MDKQKILIVDDSAENLFAMHALFEDESKYEIAQAASGPEALKMIMDNYYDLILMDVNMPDLDGFETAKLIKSRPQSSSIPLIFITGRFLDEASMLKGYEAGGLDYITKPFQPAALRKKVDFLLSFSKAIRKEQQRRDVERGLGKFNEIFEDLLNPLWAILLNVQMLKKLSLKDKQKVMNMLSRKLDNLEGSTRELKDLLLRYKDQLSNLI